MDLAHQLDRNLQLLGCLKELIIAQGNNVADLLLDLAHVAHGLTTSPVPGSPLVRIIVAPSATRRSARPVAGTADKRDVKLGLVDVVDIVGGERTSDSSM